MSTPPDPKRWTAPGADVPVDLAQLLHAGRAELGTANEVSELARRLSSVLGPASGLVNEAAGDAVADPLVPSGARAVGRLSARSSGRLVAWTTVGVSAIGAAWFAASSLSEPDGSAAPALPVPSLAPAAPEPVAAREPAATGPAAGSATPTGSERPSAAQTPSDERPSSIRRTTRRAPAARRSSQTLAEAQLLDRARAAIEADPARALTLTRDHQRRFPHGALAEEREAIATLALERLGRHEDARERAAAFERRYRGSLHRPRLDSSRDGAGKPATDAKDSRDTSSPAEGDLDTERRLR